ncbi:MAG: methyltransferase domain-containing protein [Cytophagaceae bacterium]
MTNINTSFSEDLPLNDNYFDKIYPDYIQRISKRNWSSILAAKKASEFLFTKPGCKILDIGSGVGKFCIVGAMNTKGFFYGVEYRRDFIHISQQVKNHYSLTNVTFLHENILNINFTLYDAFYFFNSFYEYLDKDCAKDFQSRPSLDVYIKCRNYMHFQLTQAPINTRVVTHSGLDSEIPLCYKLKKIDYKNDLKFWIKEE